MNLILIFRHEFFFREGHNEIYFGTGALEHPLNLESVYRHVKENSPEATTYQDLWLTVDYIFYR